MSGLVAEDQLVSCHQVVLILRIVLNQRAEVQYGEVLDAHANRVAFVRELRDVPTAVTRWLERPLPDRAPNRTAGTSPRLARSALATDAMTKPPIA
jgi:hypothetical protein